MIHSCGTATRIQLHHRARRVLRLRPKWFSVDYNTQRLDGGGSRWVYIGNGSAGTFPIATPATHCCLEWSLPERRRRMGEQFGSRAERKPCARGCPVGARTGRGPAHSAWNYTKRTALAAPPGPMAQDFHAAFALNGEDDQTYRRRGRSRRRAGGHQGAESESGRKGTRKFASSNRASLN